MLLYFILSFCLRKVFVCDHHLEPPEGYDMIEYHTEFADINLENNIDTHIDIKVCFINKSIKSFNIPNAKYIQIAFENNQEYYLVLDKTIEQLNLTLSGVTFHEEITINELEMHNSYFVGSPRIVAVNKLKSDLISCFNSKDIHNKAKDLTLLIYSENSISLLPRNSNCSLHFATDMQLTMNKNFNLHFSQINSKYLIYFVFEKDNPEFSFIPSITDAISSNNKYTFHVKSFKDNIQIQNKGKLDIDSNSTTWYLENATIPYDLPEGSNPKVLSTSEGFYCLCFSYTSYQCLPEFQLYDFSESQIIDSLVPNSHLGLQIEIAETNAKFPEINANMFDKCQVIIRKCTKSPFSRVSFNSLSSNDDFIIQYLSITELTATVLSIIPLTVEKLLFNDVIITSGVFNPIRYLEIDYNSLDALKFISEEQKGRSIVIDFNGGENIEFKTGSVVVNSANVNYVITNQIGDLVELLINTSNLYISCGTELFDFTPNITFVDDASVVFGDTWDFYQPLSKIKQKSFIRTYGYVLNISSITPNWPSPYFDVIYPVSVSTGGRYCFYKSLPSGCPTDFHKMEYSKLDIVRFHPHTTLKDVEIYIMQSSDFQMPYINSQKFLSLKNCETRIIGPGFLKIFVSYDTNQIPCNFSLTDITIMFAATDKIIKVAKINSISIDKKSFISILDTFKLSTKQLTVYQTRIHWLFGYMTNLNECDAILSYGNTLRKIIMSGNNFSIEDHFNIAYKFESSFKSVKILIAEEVFGVPIKLSVDKNDAQSNMSLPSIYSYANSVSFLFTDSCFEKQGWGNSKIQTANGTIKFISNRYTLPMYNFDIPPPGPNIIYDVLQTPTPQPKPEDMSISGGTIALIVVVVVCVILASFGVLYFVMKRRSYIASTDILFNSYATIN